MKHFLFLLTALVLGAVASLYQPFWGVFLYYTFAVLRPQKIWEWSLPVDWRWSLLAAGIAVGGALLHAARLLARARLNAVLGLLLLYGALALLSCLTAFDPVTAGYWGVEYTKILAMVVLASVVIQHLWQVRALALMVLLTLGYIGWEVNSLYFFQRRLDIFHYGIGGLDNNGAALLLAMGLPLAYAFGIGARRWWFRGVAWLLGLFMLHAMLMSYSRGAMLAALMGGLWLLIHHRSRRQAVVLAALACVAVAVLAGPQIRERFSSAARFDEDRSAQSRFESWNAAWQMAWERPILGHGIRNSQQLIQRYGADRLGRTIHSQYLQIAADSGIPALGVYLAVLVLALRRLGYCRRLCLDYLEGGPHARPAPDPDPEMAPLADIALGLQASLLIFAIGGVFLSLETFELPWLVLMLAGVMPALFERRLETLTPPAEPRPALATTRAPGARRPKRRAPGPRPPRPVPGLAQFRKGLAQP